MCPECTGENLCPNCANGESLCPECSGQNINENVNENLCQECDGENYPQNNIENLCPECSGVNINENDQLLLEISGKNITHIWVEVAIDTGNGDGETSES